MLSARSVLPILLALAMPGLAQTPSSQPSAPSAAAPAAPARPAVQDEQQDSFTVVGLTVRTTNEKEAGGQGQIPQLWQGAMAGNQLSEIPNRTSDGFVVVYSDYATDGEYNYTLGVRVSSADKVPDGFVVKKIQAGKYAVVNSDQGPPQEVIPALWQRIAQMTSEQLGGTRAYQTDFETYPEVTDWGSIRMAAHIGVK